MFKRSAVLMALAGLLGANAAWADLASDAEDAKNRRSIAESEAAIVKANADKELAESTSQQALLSTSLANSAKEIANIQAALKPADVSKTTVGAPPVLNASYYQIISDRIEEWLASGKETPIVGLDQCNEVFILRDTLPVALNGYRTANGKIILLQNNLKAALDRVEKAAIKKLEIPVAVSDARTSRNLNMIRPSVAPLVIAGGVAAVNLVASYLAAAKTSTAGASRSMAGTSEILQAAIFQKIDKSKFKLYDSNLLLGDADDGSDVQCSEGDGSPMKGLKIFQKVFCLQNQLSKAFARSSELELDPLAKDAKTDPDARLRAALVTLNATIANTQTGLQALFDADKTTGNAPINLANQGEVINANMKASSCFLTASATTADIDTIATDGTFSKYKLFIGANTSVSWSISRADGTVKASGFKSLSSPLHQYNLGS